MLLLKMMSGLFFRLVSLVGRKTKPTKQRNISATAPDVCKTLTLNDIHLAFAELEERGARAERVFMNADSYQGILQECNQSWTWAPLEEFTATLLGADIIVSKCIAPGTARIDGGGLSISISSRTAPQILCDTPLSRMMYPR